MYSLVQYRVHHKAQEHNAAGHRLQVHFTTLKKQALSIPNNDYMLKNDGHNVREGVSLEIDSDSSVAERTARRRGSSP